MHNSNFMGTTQFKPLILKVKTLIIRRDQRGCCSGQQAAGRPLHSRPRLVSRTKPALVTDGIR